MKCFAAYTLAPLAPFLLFLGMERIDVFAESIIVAIVYLAYSYILVLPICLTVHLIHAKRKVEIIRFTIYSGIGGLVWWIIFALIEGHPPGIDTGVVTFLLGCTAGLTFSIAYRMFPRIRRSGVPQNAAKQRDCL